jgi:UPF0755 protein
MMTNQNEKAVEKKTAAPQNPEKTENPEKSESEIEIIPSHFEKASGTNPEDIGFSPGMSAPNPDMPTNTDVPAAEFSFPDGIEKIPTVEVVVKKKTKVIKDRGGSVRTLAVAVSVITISLILGILLGVMIIAVGNDVFAFTYEKDEDGNPVTYTVTIDDAGMSAAEVAKLLGESGVVRYPLAFKLYAQLKKKDSFAVKVGTYTISASANYDSIMTALNPTPPREEITITFTEGMTTDDIIDLFLENGIGTREGFVEAINNYDYDFWFMKYLSSAGLSSDRYYRLDGYLYPDTYRFYSDSSEVTAIKKMLTNFNRYFGEEYEEKCQEIGMTPDEVVILASMIEAEAQKVSDYTIVSAVFHNRLNSSTFQGRLDSDATVQYYFRHTEGARHSEITSDDLKTDTPYNTYLYKGLTPGAVCNPSVNALKAAIYPEENCGYYYFVSRYNGSMLYAKTLAEHNKNVAAAKKESASHDGTGGHE